MAGGKELLGQLTERENRVFNDQGDRERSNPLEYSNLEHSM